MHALIDALTQLQISAHGNEIKKKELQLTYNKFEKCGITKHGLKLILTKNFFFADESRSYYDYAKIQFYNLLYCFGDL